MDSMTVRPKNEEGRVGYEASIHRARLSAEYDMLQRKIDAIGGFRVTIIGWSVVALGGAAAASAKVETSTILLLSGGLALLIWFFFYLEFEQVKLSRVYVARAGEIERCFIAIDRGRGHQRLQKSPTPYTANTVVSSNRSGGYAPEDTKWTVCNKSHPVIYACLSVLAISIGRHEWFNLAHKIACFVSVLLANAGSQVKP